MNIRYIKQRVGRSEMLSFEEDVISAYLENLASEILNQPSI